MCMCVYVCVWRQLKNVFMKVFIIDDRKNKTSMDLSLYVNMTFLK